MNVNDHSLGGVIVPVITPVDERDCLDKDAFAKMLRRLVAAGCMGFSLAVRRAMVRCWPMPSGGGWWEIAHEVVGDQVPLLAGAMDTSTRRVLEKIAFLRQAGYRRAALTPTFYIRTTTSSE